MKIINEDSWKFIQIENKGPKLFSTWTNGCLSKYRCREGKKSVFYSCAQEECPHKLPLTVLVSRKKVDLLQLYVILVRRKYKFTVYTTHAWVTESFLARQNSMFVGGSRPALHETNWSPPRRQDSDSHTHTHIHTRCLLSEIPTLWIERMDIMMDDESSWISNTCILPCIIYHAYYLFTCGKRHMNNISTYTCTYEYL